MYLKILYNIYFNIFGSKKLFFTLILSWILIILFTYFVLPPAADDMYYFWPALNFFYENRVGMYEGDNFVTTYFQFPTYSLINGFFLNIYDFLNIQVTSYSYKIFNKFLLLIVFVLSFTWFQNNSNTQNFYLRVNTFLILITFTPFSLGLIGSVRPEFLGIVFVLLSIILFNKERCSNFKNYLNICCSALILGLAFTVHPQFFSITSIAALLILSEIYFQAKNYKLITLYCIFFSIPIFSLFYWYFLGYPNSLDFLLNRANYIGESPILILKNNFLNLIKQAIFLTETSSFTKIYQSLYTLPYLLLLIVIIPLIFILKKGEKFLFDQKITFFIFISSLLNFTFIKTYDYYLAVIAFFLILFFCSLIKRNNLDQQIHKSIKPYLTYLSCVSIFVFNSFFIIAHSSKYLISKTEYFNFSKTKNALQPHLKDDTTLILTSDKLFGVFIDHFLKKYTHQDSNKVYMIFPFPDAGATKNQLDKAKNFLNTKLTALKKESLIFGSKKNRSQIDRVKKQIILFIENDLSISINFSEILYEDKEHIFFKPDDIKIFIKT